MRLAICLILAGLAGSLTAAEPELIATYADAITKEEGSAGWSFGWCPSSEWEQRQPLERVVVQRGKRQRVSYGVPDTAGDASADYPRLTLHGGVYASNGQLAIITYTLQKDATGDIWINHGNLLNNSSANGVLEIRVNNQQHLSQAANRDPAPHLFQTNLGQLQQGDQVQLAIGPGEGNYFGAKLSFVIQEWPASAQIGPPLNVLSPAITEAAPKREADGTYSRYAAIHEAQCQEVLERKPRLVFLGDSITYRLPADQLEALYGEYRPVNLGVSGDWLQNVLWRIENGVLEQAPIETVVLLIGTNNLSNRFSPTEVAGGTDALIQAIHDKAPGAKVLLLGIFPNGRSAPDSRANNTIRETNALLAKLAGQHEAITFLDLGEVLSEPDGSISPEIMPDGLHVTGPGFDRWLTAMDPVLRPLLPNPTP